MPTQVGRDLAFVHLEKTGGTTFHQEMVRLGLFDRVTSVPGEEHLPAWRTVKLIPRGRLVPVVGGLRCPTRWVLSWVSYMRLWLGQFGNHLGPYVDAVGKGTRDLIWAALDPHAYGIAMDDPLLGRVGPMSARVVRTYFRQEAQNLSLDELRSSWPELCLVDLFYDCDRLDEAFPVIVRELCGGAPEVCVAERHTVTEHESEVQVFADPCLRRFVEEREVLVYEMGGYESLQAAPASLWRLRPDRLRRARVAAAKRHARRTRNAPRPRPLPEHPPGGMFHLCKPFHPRDLWRPEFPSRRIVVHGEFIRAFRRDGVWYADTPSRAVAIRLLELGFVPRAEGT